MYVSLRRPQVNTSVPLSTRTNIATKATNPLFSPCCAVLCWCTTTGQQRRDPVHQHQHCHQGNKGWHHLQHQGGCTAWLCMCGWRARWDSFGGGLAVCRNDAAGWCSRRGLMPCIASAGPKAGSCATAASCAATLLFILTCPQLRCSLSIHCATCYLSGTWCTIGSLTPSTDR
jgi:hypothetical protein